MLRRFYRQAVGAVVVVLLIFSAVPAAAFGIDKPVDETDGDTSASVMRPLIERYTADAEGLSRTYQARLSPAREARFQQFYNDTLASLSSLTFDSLSHDDQVDYVLLKNHVTHQLRMLVVRHQQYQEMAPLLPFAAAIFDFDDARRRMDPPKAEQAAATLAGMVKVIQKTRRAAEAGLPPEMKSATEANTTAAASTPAPTEEKVTPIHVSSSVARRAAQSVALLRETLKTWFIFSDGYDPQFTWWVAEPYKEADQALDSYESFLKEKLVGIKAGDKITIIGDPAGRDAILADLADAMIPYTPEELIALAKNEMAWCTKEMIRASREMGYGDAWHKALEHVKEMHVPPGEQAQLIRKLALEGIDFAESHDLVTIPPLAKETWGMDMMTPERQLVNPFFTGGDTISVSYPTDTMTFDQRMMSMRGNNIPFARATVFHELIPGHYLQEYMGERYRPYRRIFETPFWIEGNAFYWEMLYWDLGFAQTPEERVGMLFWRMHRCARIIFSLNFQLGNWTPQQCVDFLIAAVGHEPDNATAEVRRSFDGSYGPLYQCAYMLGALQFRSLHKELVESGKMTNRQFHDAILHENAIPVEMVRAILTDQKLTPNFTSSWRFYGPIPATP